MTGQGILALWLGGNEHVPQMLENIVRRHVHTSKEYKAPSYNGRLS